MHLLEVTDPGLTVCPIDRSDTLRTAEQAEKDPAHKERPLYPYQAEGTSVNEANSFLQTQLEVVFSHRSNYGPMKEACKSFHLEYLKLAE